MLHCEVVRVLEQLFILLNMDFQAALETLGKVIGPQLPKVLLGAQLVNNQA